MTDPVKAAYQKGKASIKAFRSANKQDLMGDLGFTQSQMDSIFGNLRTTGAGISRQLTETQSRQLAAMHKIAAKGTLASRRNLQETRKAEVNQYGTALGPAVQQMLGVAAATGKATTAGAVGAVKAGGKLATGGQTALAIQQSASAEAYEGASYAMAVALKSRSTVDAAAAAEMQFQLEQTRLQANLELRNQKAMYDYTTQAEADALGGRQGATETAESLAGLMPTFHMFMVNNPSDTAIAEWITANVPLSLQPFFSELVPRIINRGIIHGNLGYDATVDAIVDTMVGTNPELLKGGYADKLRDWVMTALQSSWRSHTLGVLGSDAGQMLEPLARAAAAGIDPNAVPPPPAPVAPASTVPAVLGPTVSPPNVLWAGGFRNPGR